MDYGEQSLQNAKLKYILVRSILDDPTCNPLAEANVYHYVEDWKLVWGVV